MKLQRQKNGQYFLNMPLQIINAKQWKKGDVIDIEIDAKGNLVLRKK